MLASDKYNRYVQTSINTQNEHTNNTSFGILLLWKFIRELNDGLQPRLVAIFFVTLQAVVN